MKSRRRKEKESILFRIEGLQQPIAKAEDSEGVSKELIHAIHSDIRWLQGSVKDSTPAHFGLAKAASPRPRAAEESSSDVTAQASGIQAREVCHGVQKKGGNWQDGPGLPHGQCTKIGDGSGTKTLEWSGSPLKAKGYHTILKERPIEVYNFDSRALMLSLGKEEASIPSLRMLHQLGQRK